jgi:hypothetical protein
MKRFNRVRMPGGLALLLMCALIAPAQWDKKPYTQWPERDAQKLLNDSPWCKTQTFTDNPQATNAATGRPDPNASRIDVIVNVNFRIRFFSAKPVRQAVCRLIELEQKGKVSEDLAARLKALATSEFRDHIVVTVVTDADRASARLQEAMALLSSRSTAHLKNNTFLEVKGQKVFLQEYQPPRSDGFGARFLFPRLVNGLPFITPETDEVRFYSELSDGAVARPVGASGAPLIYTLNVRFKVSAMNFQGRLEY